MRFVPSSVGGSEAGAPENQKTTKFVSSGTKGRYLPRCHPRSAVCRTHDRRIVRDASSPGRSIGAALYRWRCAPEPTGRPLRPGPLPRPRPSPRVRSGGSRVHSPPPPSRLSPAAGSLRWRSPGTRPDRCPYSVVAGSMGAPAAGRQAWHEPLGVGQASVTPRDTARGDTARPVSPQSSAASTITNRSRCSGGTRCRGGS